MDKKVNRLYIIVGSNSYPSLYYLLSTNPQVNYNIFGLEILLYTIICEQINDIQS